MPSNIPQCHVVTYATHDPGVLLQLLNRNYNIGVNVLGWGHPWKGHADKVRGVFELCQRTPVTDMGIHIDGLDTVINRHPDIAVLRVLRLSPLCGILASVEVLFQASAWWGC